MESAYTLGRTTSYDRALEEAAQTGQPVLKMGRNEYEGYGGGWVWRTVVDARRFLENSVWKDDFSVYELTLPASWSECCSDVPDKTDGVHRLWRDSVIVKKVES